MFARADAPAAIHLASYAMLHSATAVLLDRRGDAPKTRAGTIGQFSGVVAKTSVADDSGVP
jgi:uncharacterized protein (UPF0332 family)